jgi:hypothetical protein
MNFRERLKQGLPKLPKPPLDKKKEVLAVLAVPDIGVSEKKNKPVTTEARHAYQYKLRDGGGMYITPADLDTARRDLLKRYGDRLLLVSLFNQEVTQ